MKNLEKRLLTVALTLIVIIFAFALAACQDIDFSNLFGKPNGNSQQKGETQQVVIIDQEQADSLSQNQGGSNAKAIFVVINSNGGKVIGSFSVSKDGVITAPQAEPIKEGFVFKGWFTDADFTAEWNFATDKVTQNVTLYAKWEAIPADPLYVIMDGNGGTVYGYFTINADGTLTAPEVTPTKEGYTFAGWYKDADCTLQWDFATDKVTENLTLYAKWTKAEEPVAVSHTLIYELNSDGESYTIVGVEPGTDTNLEIPATHDGKPVTAIGECALIGINRIVTSVTIPKSIETIGGGVFSFYESLLNVYYTGNMADWCAIKFDRIDSNPAYLAKNVYINGELIENELVIPNGVTQIGSFAFYRFPNISSVVLPCSVKLIGASAFVKEGLTAVYYNGDLSDWCDIEFSNPPANPIYYAGALYINNELVTNLTLPNTITEIKESAFARLKSITSLTIPTSIARIGKWAFFHCDNLEEIYFNGTVEQWNTVEKDRDWANTTLAQKVICSDSTVCDISHTLTYELNSDGESYKLIGVELGTENDLEIPATHNGKPVTVIGNQAFANCDRKMSSLTFFNSVKRVEGSALDNCQGFETVIFKGDVADWCEIEFESSEIFSGHVRGLSIDGVSVSDEIVIPNGVTRIGSCAFAGMKIKTVVIPASVKEIGAGAFCACYDLQDVYYLGTLADWCAITFEHPFSNPMYNAENLYINNALLAGDLVLPDTITEIKDFAFIRMQGLTSVTIPDNVVIIGEKAFSRCENLVSVTIESEEISYVAFYGCRNLTSVTFGRGVKSIGKAVFYSCPKLDEIVYNGTVEQWNEIEKACSWIQNRELTVICTDGEASVNYRGDEQAEG